MRTFLMTSSAFKGEIRLVYNDLEMLTNCDLTQAQLTLQQHTWFLKRLPTGLEDLKLLITNSTAKLNEVNQEITFDTFWKRYNDRDRSSKKKSEKIWNRLSQADQVKAYVYISTYEANRPKGTEKKYAETYLNAEQWNN